MTRRLRTAGLLCASLLLTSVLAEVVLALFLHVPAAAALLPRGSLGVFRQVYLDEIRSVVQYDPDFARYDPELFYTLKPGDFVFENAEFSTPFHVNQAGVRDRDDALVRPEAIVLGDSFAMGWGVGQDQTFAKLLERQTGMRVLNAGISSYGSARAFMLLERLDTSAMRYLIVQYCDNDLAENQSYINGGHALSISPPERLQQVFADHARAKRYRPAKYLRETVEDFIRSARQASGPQPTVAERDASARREAHAFIDVVLHAYRKPLDGVVLVVFENSPHGANRPWFANALRLEQADPAYPAFIHDMVVLDLSAPLRDTYYLLDDHIRPEGHQVIADALARVVRERP